MSGRIERWFGATDPSERADAHERLEEAREKLNEAIRKREEALDRLEHLDEILDAEGISAEEQRKKERATAIEAAEKAEKELAAFQAEVTARGGAEENQKAPDQAAQFEDFLTFLKSEEDTNKLGFISAVLDSDEIYDTRSGIRVSITPEQRAHLIAHGNELAEKITTEYEPRLRQARFLYDTAEFADSKREEYKTTINLFERILSDVQEFRDIVEGSSVEPSEKNRESQEEIQKTSTTPPPEPPVSVESATVGGTSQGDLDSYLAQEGKQYLINERQEAEERVRKLQEQLQEKKEQGNGTTNVTIHATNVQGIQAGNGSFGNNSVEITSNARPSEQGVFHQAEGEEMTPPVSSVEIPPVAPEVTEGPVAGAPEAGEATVLPTGNAPVPTAVVAPQPPPQPEEAIQYKKNRDRSGTDAIDRAFEAKRDAYLEVLKREHEKLPAWRKALGWAKKPSPELELAQYMFNLERDDYQAQKREHALGIVADTTETRNLRADIEDEAREYFTRKATLSKAEVEQRKKHLTKLRTQYDTLRAEQSKKSKDDTESRQGTGYIQQRVWALSKEAEAKMLARAQEKGRTLTSEELYKERLKRYEDRYETAARRVGVRSSIELIEKEQEAKRAAFSAEGHGRAMAALKKGVEWYRDPKRTFLQKAAVSATIGTAVFIPFSLATGMGAAAAGVPVLAIWGSRLARSYAGLWTSRLVLDRYGKKKLRRIGAEKEKTIGDLKESDEAVNLSEQYKKVKAVIDKANKETRTVAYKKMGYALALGGATSAGLGLIGMDQAIASAVTNPGVGETAGGVGDLLLGHKEGWVEIEKGFEHTLHGNPTASGVTPNEVPVSSPPETPPTNAAGGQPPQQPPQAPPASTPTGGGAPEKVTTTPMTPTRPATSAMEDVERTDIPAHLGALPKAPEPIHIEHTMVHGDTVWKTLLKPAEEAYTRAHDGINLTPGERNEVIELLRRDLARLTPEELKAHGIASGNLDIVHPGENVHFDIDPQKMQGYINQVRLHHPTGVIHEAHIGRPHENPLGSPEAFARAIGNETAKLEREYFIDTRFTQVMHGRNILGMEEITVHPAQLQEFVNNVQGHGSLSPDDVRAMVGRLRAISTESGVPINSNDTMESFLHRVAEHRLHLPSVHEYSHAVAGSHSNEVTTQPLAEVNTPKAVPHAQVIEKPHTTTSTQPVQKVSSLEAPVSPDVASEMRHLLQEAHINQAAADHLAKAPIGAILNYQVGPGGPQGLGFTPPDQLTIFALKDRGLYSIRTATGVNWDPNESLHHYLERAAAAHLHPGQHVEATAPPAHPTGDTIVNQPPKNPNIQEASYSPESHFLEPEMSRAISLHLFHYAGQDKDLHMESWNSLWQTVQQYHRPLTLGEVFSSQPADGLDGQGLVTLQHGLRFMAQDAGIKSEGDWVRFGRDYAGGNINNMSVTEFARRAQEIFERNGSHFSTIARNVPSANTGGGFTVWGDTTMHYNNYPYEPQRYPLQQPWSVQRTIRGNGNFNGGHSDHHGR